MRQYTPYGAKIRGLLLEKGQTLSSLANEVSERTGLYVDQQYLYKIFTGDRNAPKVVAAINEILGIEVQE